MTNDDNTVLVNGAFAALPTRGSAGTQSGDSVRRQDAMFSQPAVDVGAFAPGAQGTQAGPVEESTSAQNERLLQSLGGDALTLGGGVLGAATTEGNPFAIAAGAIPGRFVDRNASAPNIQDVWLHQLIQKLRTSGRGP